MMGIEMNCYIYSCPNITIHLLFLTNYPIFLHSLILERIGVYFSSIAIAIEEAPASSSANHLLPWTQEEEEVGVGGHLR